MVEKTFSHKTTGRHNLLMNSLPNLEDKYENIRVGKYADDIALWLKPSICRKKTGNTEDQTRTEVHILPVCIMKNW